LKGYGDLESKFRFVILASKRAKQLLRGAKPKIKTKSKNNIRIAQEEVEKGLIDYVFVERTADDVVEEDMFIGEDIDGPAMDLGRPFSVEELRKKVVIESPEEAAIRRAVLEAVKDDNEEDEEEDSGDADSKDESGLDEDKADDQSEDKEDG
jgi:DNA-directed RNA polymerase omega subunit